MRILSSFILIMLVTLSQAQNLVPNPSFETFEKCPKGYTDWTPKRLLVPGWTYPSKGTPDYFNECAKGTKVGVPENFMGKTKARTGTGYIGIFILGQSDYTEYIQSALIQPLEAGQKYCINYWYRLAQNGQYAADRLDLFFSKTKIFKNVESFLKLRPQVTNPAGKMLQNKDGWALYSAVYEASGNEEYMIIGNFAGHKKTKRKLVRDKTGYVGKGRFSYYYVDDVSVTLITDCKECEGIPKDLAVKVKTSYSATTDRSTSDGIIQLDVTGGQAPYHIEWDGQHEGFTLQNLPFGEYTYKVKDHYNCEISEKVTFFTAIADTSFQGGNTGKITLDITGGCEPYKVRWSNGATERTLQNLSEGDYKYTVSDGCGLEIEGLVSFSEFSNRLKGINEGDAIVLDNIFFARSSIELLPQSYAALNQIVDFFRESGISLVEVSGHTDSTGSKALNNKISEGRAKTVVDYLLERGIDKERIVYVGAGPKQPVAPNNTAEGRQKNRRVEFKVVRK